MGDLAPFLKVSCTDDAPAGVVTPITGSTAVALKYVHVARGPVLAVAPTAKMQQRAQACFRDRQARPCCEARATACSAFQQCKHEIIVGLDIAIKGPRVSI